MSLDRDLRDALQPLGGDPIADAMRVLAALPPGPPVPPQPTRPTRPPSPKRPPQVPWGLLLAALMGLAVGIAIGAWSFGQAPAPTVPPPPAVPPTKEEPPTKLEPKARESEPSAMVDRLQMMAFGELVIDEPGVGRQELKPGPYTMAVGTLCDTGTAMAGLYVYANDVRIRLDRDTVALVSPELVTMRRGRLWISNLARPADLTVRTDRADVQANAAELMVETHADELWVCCLDGEATVRPKGGAAIRLQAQQQVEWDFRTGLGEVQGVPFAGSVTSWMTRMIVLQQDDAELQERIAQMLAAYREGAHRDAAALELRRLGAPVVGKLFLALESMAGQPDLLHSTAALIADLAQMAQVDYLLAMLERGDAETRVLAFRALVRVSGEAVEDEAFWRDGDAERRDAAVGKWRWRLR